METILFTRLLVYVDAFYCVRPLTYVNSCKFQSFPVFHVSGAALWEGPHLGALAVAVATPPSSPSDRRYTAESRYRTSGGGEPGWASAFCVISISKRVLTSDSRAPPRGPSFSGVLPGGTERDAWVQLAVLPSLFWQDWVKYLPKVEKEEEESRTSRGWKSSSGDGGPLGMKTLSW